jgi:hypothetical protein
LNAFEPAQLPQPMRERIRACENLRLRPAARSLLH